MDLGEGAKYLGDTLLVIGESGIARSSQMSSGLSTLN